MKDGFHYYITYLVSTYAGFSPSQAETIAYSAQFVDDNTKQFTIDKNEPYEYTNYISQTFNILKPRKDLMRIYPVFHFLPGDPDRANPRLDGLKHELVTTPASHNAKDMIWDAGYTENLYRLGIACHVYADTFAHQDFVGLNSVYNKMPGWINSLIPNIGHADAKQKPDLASLFVDRRNIKTTSYSFNPEFSERFLLDTFIDAALSLYKELSGIKKKYFDGSDRVASEERKEELTYHLQKAIKIDSKDDSVNHGVKPKECRITCLKDISVLKRFGEQLVPTYDKNRWFNDAIKPVGNFFLKKYMWRHPSSHMCTPWYKFQEAVKDHQKHVLAMLEKRNMKQMKIKNL